MKWGEIMRENVRGGRGVEGKWSKGCKRIGVRKVWEKK